MVSKCSYDFWAENVDKNVMLCMYASRSHTYKVFHNYTRAGAVILLQFQLEHTTYHDKSIHKPTDNTYPNIETALHWQCWENDRTVVVVRKMKALEKGGATNVMLPRGMKLDVEWTEASVASAMAKLDEVFGTVACGVGEYYEVEFMTMDENPRLYCELVDGGAKLVLCYDCEMGKGGALVTTMATINTIKHELFRQGDAGEYTLVMRTDGWDVIQPKKRKKVVVHDKKNINFQFTNIL
jgi:hypothetical protein